MKQPSINTLDIEASGIHPDSYPIEIGIVLANGDSYCRLIKPAPEWTHWCKAAEKIHGISREELEKNGRPIEEIAQDLNKYLGQSTVYSDCWVLDKPWLTTLFSKTHINATFTLSDIMYTLCEDEYDNLISAKNQAEQTLKLSRHRATNDAKILQLAYDCIKKQE